MRLRSLALTLLASALAFGLLLALAAPLGSPPISSWRALERWYDTHGAARSLVAMLRAAALVGCAWLVMATGLQLLARATRAPVLLRAADRVTPLVTRSLAAGAASLSVSAAVSLPAAAGDPTGTAVMVPLDAPPPTSSTTTATTEPVPAPDPPVVPVPAPPPPVSAPTADADQIVVEPGDSFWSIAVEEAAGRDVDAYWRSLIEANRDRLTDPDNPDLLYSGQVLTLP